ncbi:MAG: YdcF family protein [Lachnospiraceae bacterium]|nr:YdcF family protein [Lachnospiraceae bacterium]
MTYPSQSIKAITEFLFIGIEERNIVPSDLVIVLGNDAIGETVDVLASLIRKGYVKENADIILTGANGTLNQGKDLECNRLYDCAVNEYGLPSGYFMKEPNALNTYQNFQYSKQIIEQKGGFEKYKNILCIGKAFLLRRASMYAAKVGYPAEKMQYFGTVDTKGKNIGKDTWWERDDSISRVLAEVRRIGEYGEKGDLSIF